MTTRTRNLTRLLAATLAALTFILLAADWFIAFAFFAALTWAGVLMVQRDEARTLAARERRTRVIASTRRLSLIAENTALLARVAELEAECDELHQENMALHLQLTEAQLLAGDTPPSLSIVRDSPIHDDLAVEELRAQLNDEWFNRLHGWGESS